jgi:hypothetical protein
LIVSEDISLNGRLFTSGDVSMNSRLFVRQDASFNARILVGSDLSIGGRLFVNGTQFTGTGGTGGTGGSVFTTYLSTTSRLFVNQDASFNSRILVGSDVSLGGRLFVRGNAIINGSLSVTGNITYSNVTTTTTSYNITGDISTNNRLFVTNMSTLGNAGLVEVTPLSHNVNSITWKTNNITWNITSSGNNGLRPNYFLFNPLQLGSGWTTNTGTYNNGLHNGSVTTTFLTSPGQQRTISGEWVQIQSSVPLRASNYTLGVSNPNTIFPKSFYILGSNNGTNWDAIQYGNMAGSPGAAISIIPTVLYTNAAVTNSTYGTTTITTTIYSSYNTNSYTYFRLVIETLQATATGIQGVRFGQWGIYFLANSQEVPESGSLLSVVGNTTMLGNTSINGNLSVSRSVTINGTAIIGGTSYTSDYRIKSNIEQLDGSYTVQNLIPRKYYNKQMNRYDLGLIAHELQEQYPLLVNGEKDGENYQSVNYIGLIPLLINDIQNQQQQIFKLTNQLEKQESIVKKQSKYIPNVFGLATVTENNQLELIDKTTRDLSGEEIKLKLIDYSDNDIFVTVDTIIDDTHFTIKESLSKTDLSGNEIFVYGQEVEDFHILDKETIFTVGIGAIKKLDEESIIANKKLEVIPDLLNEIETQKQQINVLISEMKSMKQEIELLKEK